MILHIGQWKHFFNSSCEHLPTYKREGCEHLFLPILFFLFIPCLFLLLFTYWVFLCAPNRIIGTPNNFNEVVKISFSKKFKKAFSLSLPLYHVVATIHRESTHQSLGRCRVVSDSLVIFFIVNSRAPYPSVCLILFCGLGNSYNAYRLSICMSYMV